MARSSATPVSSVSSSLADLVAEELGRSNRITRAQAVESAEHRRQGRDRYLADHLAAGTHVSEAE